MTIVVFFFSSLLCTRLARTLGYGQQTNFLMHFYFEREPTNSVFLPLSLSISASVDRSRSTITNSKCLAQRGKTDVLFYFIHSPRNKFQSTASPPRHTIFNSCMNRRPPKVNSELNALLENQFLCPSTHCMFVDVTAAWNISKSIPVERVKIQ